jgi:hypothetical protein
MKDTYIDTYNLIFEILQQIATHTKQKQYHNTLHKSHCTLDRQQAYQIRQYM